MTKPPHLYDTLILPLMVSDLIIIGYDISEDVITYNNKQYIIYGI